MQTHRFCSFKNKNLSVLIHYPVHVAFVFFIWVSWVHTITPPPHTQLHTSDVTPTQTKKCRRQTRKCGDVVHTFFFSQSYVNGQSILFSVWNWNLTEQFRTKIHIQEFKCKLLPNTAWLINYFFFFLCFIKFFLSYTM